MKMVKFPHTGLALNSVVYFVAYNFIRRFAYILNFPVKK